MKPKTVPVWLAPALILFTTAFPFMAGHGAPPPPVSEARVKELQSLRFGMFICWSFSTFSGKEWTPGVTNLDLFAAKDCDTDQWAKTAKDAGMGYILFLTKHHDGFCLWDTKTTDRKVTKAKLGRDVLAEVKKSCDKYGLKLALYFSEGEWAWPDFPDGRKRRANGGCNPELKKAQLAELLTQYGPIEYIWFDYAVGDGGLSHADTVAFVKSLQPDCFSGFNNGDQGEADIRLGEEGRPGALDDQAAAGKHMDHGAAQSYRLAEFTYPILPQHQGGAMWFYSLPKHDGLCLPAEKIYADYLGAVKFGNLFSVDVGPDYIGRLREIDVQTLRKVGQYIRGERKVPDAQTTLDAKRRLEKLGSGMEVIVATNGIEAEGHHFTYPDVFGSLRFIMKHAAVLPGGREYFQVRGGLSNSRVKFEKEKAGRVAFLGGSITFRIHAGQFTRAGDFKNLHPSPFGQQLYASSIARLLEAAFVQTVPPASKHPLPASPLNSHSCFHGRFGALEMARFYRDKGVFLACHWSGKLVDFAR